MTFPWIVERNEPMNATDDRRIELEERRRKTYLGHALDDELDLGGRFKKVSTSSVVGVGPISYPAQSSGPWSKDECPQENQLGYSVDAIEPVGEVHEIEASRSVVKGDRSDTEHGTASAGRPVTAKFRRRA
jgi:hypothetical protein